MTDARALMAIAGAALCIQFGFQSWSFPLSELFSATPLTYTDGAFHLYRMEVFRELCRNGQWLGYDPYFAAGQLRGLTYSSSAKVQALLGCVLDGPNAAAVAYKVVSFAFSLLAVVALPLACALLRLAPAVSALATLFGFILWWATPIRWFHTAGMASFVAAAFLSIPYAVWLSRCCLEGNRGRWTLLAVVLAGATGTVVHALFTVCVAPVVLAFWCSRRPSRTVVLRTVLLLSALASMALLFNAPWFYDALRLPPGLLRGEQPYQRLVDPVLPLLEMLRMAPTPGGGSRFFAVLFVGCICLLWVSQTHISVMPTSPAASAAPPGGAGAWPLWPLCAAGGLLLVFSAVGAAHPGLGNLLQPNRFSMPGWLCLAIPAAAGVDGVARRLWLVWRQEQLGAARALALPAALLLFCSAGTAFYVRELALEVHGAQERRYGVARPEVKPLGELSQSVVQALKPTTAEDDGRVLFEVSQDGAYDDAHIAGLYALWSQREFIGGPYPHFHEATLQDGIFFGRPLASISAAELSAAMDLYNVTLVVCHSKVCHHRFAAADGLAQVARWDEIGIYRRAVVSNYLQAGQGRVTGRSVNRVEVESKSTDDIVLKYHWVPGLVSVPPLQLEARLIGEDPQPFVVVKSPPRRFVLTVR